MLGWFGETCANLVVCAFESVRRSTGWLLSAVHDVVAYPVMNAYVHGVGFWGGAPRDQICAGLTNIHSHHWKEHDAECSGLITRKVDGILALLVLGFYLSTCVIIYFKFLHAALSALC